MTAATPRRRNRLQAAALVAIGLITLFTGLGSVPLFDKDEGAFAEATREMLVTGNYLMTYLNGEPRYDKPILIYWLQAASAHAFGVNEFAMRLPSAVAGALWALVTYRFTRRRAGADVAFLATLFLLTAVQTTLIMKAAIADSLFNLWIAASMACFLEHAAGRSRAWRHLGFVAVGLGVLTKGPVALLVPLVTTLLFALTTRRVRAWVRAAFDPIGWALLLLVALPWPLAAWYDQGNALLFAWLHHTVGRAARPMEGHSGAILYYVPVVLVGLVPFTTLFIRSLTRIRHDLRSPLRRWCWLWFLFVFVLMSLVATKLPHYVIYGYTPLFVLMALHARETRWPMLVALPAVLLFATLAALPLLLKAALPWVDDAFAAAIIQDALPGLTFRYWGPLVAGAAFAFGLGLLPRAWSRTRLTALGLLTAALVNGHVVPQVARVTQTPLKEAALLARERGVDVVKWDLNMPSFVFYRGALVEERMPKVGEVVVTKAPRLDELAAVGIVPDVWYASHGIVLARLREGPAPAGAPRRAPEP